MQTIQYKNSYGDLIKGASWEIRNAKSNLLIVTGMQEHAFRYDEFAKFLNENGFNVYCLDHYGQGLNIEDLNRKGIWPINGFEKTVDTNKEFVEKLNEKNVTYIFGHSMGSFIVQRLLSKYPTLTKKAVICGSDFPAPSLMKFGYGVSKILVNKKNFNMTSTKIHKLVTGPFAKAIKNNKTEFDWLSYDENNVNKYIADEKCGFIATNGFYKEFLKGTKEIGKQKIMSNVDKNVSIYIIAGIEDPVGHFSKGPKKLFNVYKKLGIKDVTLKIYEHMRHEILNEKEKEVVFNDVLQFLKK